MNLQEIAVLLNEASRYLTPPTKLEARGLSTRPDEWIQFETAALDAALDAAEKFPESEFEFWKVMADSFNEFNERLRCAGAPELRLIPYSAFLAMIQEDGVASRGAAEA